MCRLALRPARSRPGRHASSPSAMSARSERVSVSLAAPRRNPLGPKDGFLLRFPRQSSGASFMRSKRLTVGQKKEIFRSLVETQDQGQMSVADSMKHVCQLFQITEHQLRQIQEEGINKEWPPLDEEIVEM